MVVALFSAARIKDCRDVGDSTEGPALAPDNAPLPIVSYGHASC
jgi:hypothetical protein